MANPMKVRAIISWSLQILISLQFTLSGLEKFIDPENWERRFRGWGYPDEFFFVVGAFELVLAILILIPRTFRLGSAGTVILMFGATATHIRAADGHYWAALLTGILAACVYYLRATQVMLRQDQNSMDG